MLVITGEDDREDVIAEEDDPPIYEWISLAESSLGNASTTSVGLREYRDKEDHTSDGQTRGHTMLAGKWVVIVDDTLVRSTNMIRWGGSHWRMRRKP
ncbi:hypothetical protein MRB53_015494 [Persea americana]|uniref:Uncharacterized protein n=1 Tax=Persea americana TaxID=3435 RepID=A0ACC2LZH9_PERAE|nr:hypothetical protein MRB53_015494 [Persea americana]